MGARLPTVLLATWALPIAGCGADELRTGPITEDDPGALFCNVSSDELAFALVPEAILSLQDPPLVGPDHPDASYVDDHDRVVGLHLEGEPVAVPLDVLRYHEVANFSRASVDLAVTYCPLTGSSIVFDRSAIGGIELGVSGVLHKNNLVLYDRAEPASFFTQMRGGVATCGPSARNGTGLSSIPSMELRWDAWERLHPNTLVVSQQTGSEVDFGDYRVNGYEEYERIDNPHVLVPFEIDRRRLPKERVLGIPGGGDGGPVFPFGELARQEHRAVSALNGAAVVFWDRAAEAAVAFSTEVDGEVLTFESIEGGFSDVGSGSRWRLDGLAVDGPLAGERLAQIPEAFVSFWFAWAAFFPETAIWDASGG